MKFTKKELQEVPCIQCDAKIGEPCTEHGVVILGSHRMRLQLRKKYPALPKGENSLTSTEKSVIVYYAFVMLCDSCEANSLKLFGKQISSQDIQRLFAQHGLAEARKDGIIQK